MVVAIGDPKTDKEDYMSEEGGEALDSRATEFVEQSSESEDEEREVKRFKPDNLQDTEDLARQLLGDL